MPINPPDSNPKRELARKLADVVLAGVPIIGGPLAAIYSVTHPAKGEQNVEAWQGQITSLVNELEEVVAYISGTIVLSEDAAYLGKWISENSTTAFSEIFGYDQIVSQFFDASPNEILEAVGELEIEGMVVVQKCLGKPFSHLRANHKLFEVFDPIVFGGVSPRQDATLIAEKLLNSESGVSASDICEDQGWTPRRFNPAVDIVGEFIADGRKSRPMGQEYSIRALFVDARERAQLRRFVNTVNGNN
ncbi:hypothetical protein R3X27_25085 [Tropicimonas sp. TH_r6]|uniref:hypothetical protein n=1 Tax=Tropicimonas sp. TH_r6 TaxID=3082085 RepID=UPI002954883B|nr:hypothetical protein [Tropicimonas sp. TH_r6]MDV7145964.1 hypothetical protein [Tropicimonas sp. TH_r6]